MAKDLHLDVCGCEVRVDRIGETSPDYVLSARVYDGEDFHDVGTTLNLHSGRFSDDERFNPRSRSDWTKEDVERAITEAIERNWKVDAEDVVAVTDVEIVERRTFISQGWEDASVQLFEAGVIPEDDYSGPEPEEYRDD